MGSWSPPSWEPRLSEQAAAGSAGPAEHATVGLTRRPAGCPHPTKQLALGTPCSPQAAKDLGTYAREPVGAVLRAHQLTPHRTHLRPLCFAAGRPHSSSSARQPSGLWSGTLRRQDAHPLPQHWPLPSLCARPSSCTCPTAVPFTLATLSGGTRVSSLLEICSLT